MRRLVRRADGLRVLRNSSSICTPRGLFAFGLSACSTSSGTITVRAQYEILSRWNGNQLGSSMISTGITGTLRQRDHAVERQQRAREHVGLRRAAAREDRLARAPHVIGASMSSPIILSAK